MMTNIVKISSDNINGIIPLIAKFRAELKRFKKINAAENLCAAEQEAAEFLSAGFPIYAYFDCGMFVGYAICRIDGAVWLEHLYVLPSHRGKDVADALFSVAEKVAAPGTLYNWVHPNNSCMIAFLAKRGYDTLNLIEIRKEHEGEILSDEVRVGDNAFRY